MRKRLMQPSVHHLMLGSSKYNILQIPRCCNVVRFGHAECTDGKKCWRTELLRLGSRLLLGNIGTSSKVNIEKARA